MTHAYKLVGDKGFRLVFASKKRHIIIGTQRPDELQGFLERHYRQLSNSANNQH